MALAYIAVVAEDGLSFATTVGGSAQAHGASRNPTVSEFIPTMTESAQAAAMIGAVLSRGKRKSERSL